MYNNFAILETISIKGIAEALNCLSMKLSRGFNYLPDLFSHAINNIYSYIIKKVY